MYDMKKVNHSELKPKTIPYCEKILSRAGVGTKSQSRLNLQEFDNRRSSVQPERKHKNLLLDNSQPMA